MAPIGLTSSQQDAHVIVQSLFESLEATDEGAKVDLARIGHGGALAAQAVERAFYELLDAYLSEERKEGG